MTEKPEIKQSPGQIYEEDEDGNIIAEPDIDAHPLQEEFVIIGPRRKMLVGPTQLDDEYRHPRVSKRVTLRNVITNEYKTIPQKGTEPLTIHQVTISQALVHLSDKYEIRSLKGTALHEASTLVDWSKEDELDPLDADIYRIKQVLGGLTNKELIISLQETLQKLEGKKARRQARKNIVEDFSW